MKCVRTCLWLASTLILAAPRGAQEPVSLGPSAVTVGGAVSPTRSAAVAANLISMRNPARITLNSVTYPRNAGVAPGSIPPTFFGMHMHADTYSGRNPWPAVPFGTLRMWDTRTQWMQMNRAPGLFDFSQLDKVLSMAAAHNVTDILFTLAGTPDWAATVRGDTSCRYPANGPGFCQPPEDLNPDGSGPDRHWKEFVAAVAKHAAGRIKYWEVWNEPSDPRQWKGTFAQLARMTRDASTIIKDIDPGALITTPTPVSDAYSFMSKFLKAGGASAVDVITFHGYGGNGQPPERVLNKISAIREAAAESGISSRPIWDTEGSWGRNVNVPDPDEQAAFLARFYLVQQSAGIARFWWYSWNEPLWGTLWDASGIRPAGVAYEQVYHWLVGARSGGPCSREDSVWSCGLTREPNYRAIAVWDASQTCSAGECTTSRYIVPPGFVGYRDLAGQTGAVTPGSPIRIGAKPILLENQ